MSKLLNNIGQKAKNAFKERLNTKIKNKVLEDYWKLIKKNKKKLIIENKKDVKVAKSKKLKENLVKHIPLRRIGKVSEIAETALFLSSNEAGYITGQTIAVNGGLYM